jgi:hypothetical protein
MRSNYKCFGGFAAGILALAGVFAAHACAQDSPSLGDLARQQRQQKDQGKGPAKTTPNKAAKAPKVITNEEIPSHLTPASAPAAKGEEDRDSAAAPSDEAKLPAEQWKSQIAAQKNQVDALQKQIDEVNESIHFAPGNCVANCVQWNERQQEKQRQVEQMRAQLEEQKKRLEVMQDSARKQGYGSSVYDQ